MFQRTCIIKARGILWNIVLTNLTARFVGYFVIHVRWFCFLLVFLPWNIPNLKTDSEFMA